MRFKVDENLPIEVGEVFRAAGHDATTVNDEGIGGANDPDIATILRRENRAIVTLDVGSGDIRLYPPTSTRGSSCFVSRGKTRPWSSASASASLAHCRRVSWLVACGLSKWTASECGAARGSAGPRSKRMQLTRLRAAPVRAYKVPPCAPAGETDGGTASQLIRSVGQTIPSASARR
jgi:hypothetical protein